MLQQTTIIFIIAASVLAVLHNISLQLFLYWRYAWLDIPMHVLGGAVVTLGWFTLYDFRVLKSTYWQRFLIIISIVFLVAFGWELYEYCMLSTLPSDYYLDTVTDITMGLIGGSIGYIVSLTLRKFS